MIANNRISALLDDAPDSAPLPRSPAQRRASRRNGARSRGPATAAGKARSRLNALKHGLLARLVSPPGDHRMHDQLYRKIHRQLMEEFRPRTFSQRMLVDTLASDFLQLGRAREMVEAYIQPRLLAERDEAQYLQLADLRRDHRFLRALSIGLDTHRVPTCGRRQAVRLAELMVSTIKTFEDDLQEIAAAEAEGCTAGSDGNVSEVDDDPFEREELRIDRELHEAVGGTRGKFGNTGWLAGILCGEKLSADDVRPLRLLVARVAENMRRWIGSRGDLSRRVRVTDNGMSLQLAQAPQQLLLMQRYTARLERQVERKLALLRH